MDRGRKLWVAAIIGVAGAVALAAAVQWYRNDRWMKRTPLLVVELRGDLSGLDVEAYRRAFSDAGVSRLAFVEGPSLRAPVPAPAWSSEGEPAPRTSRIVIEGRRGLNPHVEPASRKRNMQGPGYTEGQTAVVYLDDLTNYMRKHADVWAAAERGPSGAPASSSPSPVAASASAGPPARPSPAAAPPRYDEASVWRHLVTNTAVHESWHAITNSHSHNPSDIESVMYVNAADNVALLGTRYLGFTRGHRTRLVEMFQATEP